MREERVKRLKEARDEALMIAEFLQSIIDGTATQSDLAKELDIPDVKLSYEIKRKFSTRFKDYLSESELRSVLLASESPCELLFKHIVGIPDTELVYLDPEKETILKEVTEEALTESELKIIQMRHGFNSPKMTLEEVGKALQVSSERVRQKEAKAMRKLRRPSCLNRLVEIENMKYTVAEKTKVMKQRREAVVERLKESIRTEIDNLDVMKHDLEKKYELMNDPVDPDSGIEYLNLSTRTYNALARAGYRHISDLRGVTMIDLFKIRNMGCKSMEELIFALNSMGIEVPEH